MKVKEINRVVYFSIIMLIFTSICSADVYAKSVSNTLKSVFNIEHGEIKVLTVGRDVETINEGIETVCENGIVKVKGGTYNLQAIVNKSVKLISEDGKYVDIFVELDILTDLKIQLGTNVILRKIGQPPIKIGVLVGGKDAEVKDGKIHIDTGSGESTELQITTEIANKYGFHDSNLVLKFDNNEGVHVYSQKKEIPLNVSNNFCVGKIENNLNTKLNLKFDNKGIYNINIYVDDCRLNMDSFLSVPLVKINKKISNSFGDKYFKIYSSEISEGSIRYAVIPENTWIKVRRKDGKYFYGRVSCTEDNTNIYKINFDKLFDKNGNEIFSIVDYGNGIEMDRPTVFRIYTTKSSI